MKIRRLGEDDVAMMQALNALFADVFEEPDTFCGHWDDEGELARRLADPNVWAVVAFDGDRLIGGLTGYTLQKLEAPVREFYIYDLAVAVDRQRQGVGKALLQEACAMAGVAGARLAFIQADLGDEAPIGLYRSLATEEIVAHHFDLPTKDA